MPAKHLTATDEQRRQLLRKLLAEEFGDSANENVPHPDDWLPVDDTLPVAARTVRDAVKAGALEGYQVDRTTLLVRRRDFDAWVASHKVTPRAPKDDSPAPPAPASELDAPVAALADKLGLKVG